MIFLRGLRSFTKVLKRLRCAVIKYYRRRLKIFGISPLIIGPRPYDGASLDIIWVAIDQ
jgi:hypothetical protein